ncbi:MAG: hypothetical protein OQK73_03085 [Gammaproteobacteria bacterium]|nr:hypothetical protein [Gammaproteobacteria bacterium]
MNTAQIPSYWWGKFNFDMAQIRQWRIGALTLNVQCLQHEWQVAYEQDRDFDENNVSYEINEIDVFSETLKNTARYIFRETSGLLTVTPLLADRPVISRPNTTFNLTPGEEVKLYVSTPLWLRLGVDNTEEKLAEIAIQRPSDTWFGPSTLEGELCYASTTHCRLNLEEMPHRPHRAITPVIIQNQANTMLAVDRLNVPTPLLSLYASSNGHLWTPTISLVREKDGDMAGLKIDTSAPIEAHGGIQLSQPRQTGKTDILIRAFNAVFT